MSEINVNIVETTIKSNRTPLSMLGAKMFGQDVFTPQTRMFNPDHDKVLGRIVTGKQIGRAHV